VTQFYGFPVQREDPCVRVALFRGRYSAGADGGGGCLSRMRAPARALTSRSPCLTLGLRQSVDRNLALLVDFFPKLSRLQCCRWGVSALLNQRRAVAFLLFPLPFHLPQQNSVRHMGPRSLYGVHLALPPVINIAQTLLWHES
jgi:hypothetical protein